MDATTSPVVLPFPAAAKAGPAADSPTAAPAEPLWRELVGQVLRSERVETRRTLQQVADRAGVSPQYLSEVERGRKDPSSEMLESICGALGLRLADLMVVSGRTLRCASPVGQQAAGRHSPIGQQAAGQAHAAGVVLLAA